MTPCSYEALYKPQRGVAVVLAYVYLCLFVALYVGVMLLLGGCTGQAMANGKAPVAKAEALRPVAAAEAPVLQVTLNWDAFEVGELTNQVHLVVAQSTDLQAWTVCTDLPCCATSLVVQATGQRAFYRVGWGWGFYRAEGNWE